MDSLSAVMAQITSEHRPIFRANIRQLFLSTSCAGARATCKPVQTLTTWPYAHLFKEFTLYLASGLELLIIMYSEVVPDPRSFPLHHLLSNHRFPTTTWVIGHNHRVFGPSSTPPCRTTKARPAPRCPATLWLGNSKTATQSNPLPPYFESKHERSAISEAERAGS